MSASQACRFRFASIFACRIRQVESRSAVLPGEIKLGSSNPIDGQSKAF
jgi:hypothetical protein